MLLYDEKTLHWPLTTHCWGAQGCRGNIEAQVAHNSYHSLKGTLHPQNKCRS